MAKSYRLKDAAPAAFFLALLAALAGLKMCQDVDHDLFWQLKDGERIVLQHRLPVVEDYSFTSAGKPMVATAWLAETVHYLVFRAAGYGGLVVFNACLFAAIFALMLGLARRRLGQIESFCLVSLAAFAFLNFYGVRSQNWTFLFTALFLYWAALWEDGRRWVPWAMAAIMLPWANLHGGFMVGWAILALVCGRQAWQTRHLSDLAPLGLGTMLCCVHPNGTNAFVYPIWFMAAPPPGRGMILEWRPVSFGEASAAPYLLILLLLLWLGLDAQPGRFPWGGLTLALTILAFRGRKLLPEFAMAAIASLGLKFQSAGTKFSRRLLLPAGAVSLGVTCWLVISWSGDASLDMERAFPREAVRIIAERYPGARVFNNYDWGGYLLYKLYPRNRVFIDGRLDPYWTLLPGDYETVKDEKPGWQKLLDEYQISVVLLRPTDRLGEGLSRDPQWKLVYVDSRSALFSR